MNSTQSQIVLVGAGHAHLHVARHAQRFGIRGAHVIIVDPGEFWYSGLATGMLGGMYDRSDDTIDLGALASRHGGELISGRAVGIDRDTRKVHLDSGEDIDYDLLSFNVGSVATQLPGADEHAWPVKPIANLWRLRLEIESRLTTGSPEHLRIAVIGGGATGCEVAANLDALASRHPGRMTTTLFTSGDRLLGEHPPRVSRSIRKAFDQRSTIRVRTHLGVQRIEPGAIVDESGTRHEADFVVAAAGLRASPLMAKLPLPAGRDGGLLTESTLESTGDARVFGAGDCIDFDGRNLPKLGVFGVRQAPVLLHNLLASLDGRSLAPYRPQRRWLTILNLGDGTALAVRRPFHWRGRLSMRLKDRLDGRFLRKYR